MSTTTTVCILQCSIIFLYVNNVLNILVYYLTKKKKSLKYDLKFLDFSEKQVLSVDSC